MNWPATFAAASTYSLKNPAVDLNLLIENLRNPALLFFLLGILAVAVRSDLRIPANTSKFISLYLLFAIGFKGGHELQHETFSPEIFATLATGICSALLIPVVTFSLLRKRLGIYNAGAVAAAYGSVSAVTFVTAANYLENLGLEMHGHLVALMAMMEAPAIIMGLLLISLYKEKGPLYLSKRQAFIHSFTNGSVFLILGSLLIGYLANDAQADGIRPFTNDLFKGFLVIFLLDMGISSGKNLKGFVKNGYLPLVWAIVAPLVIGVTVALFSGLYIEDTINRFTLATLAASASYIAVPAAMKLAVPQANPGLYLPMALAITFPINITIGLPLYYGLSQYSLNELVIALG